MNVIKLGVFGDSKYFFYSIRTCSPIQNCAVSMERRVRAEKKSKITVY